MDLGIIREEIDTIDKELLELFKKRMECSIKVAEYKKENGVPIVNTSRENVLSPLR